MELVLIGVTIASATVALGMGAIVVRMLRDERRRSDARVEALMELAAATPTDGPESSDHEDLALNSPVAGVGALFIEPETRSPWGNRLAAAAACAAVIAIIGLVFTSLPERAGRPASGAAASEGKPAGAPLELLSLRHTTEGDGLTITGMVQNPRGGVPLSDVTATAFVFAQDGSLVASGRAPLDFTQLRPGDESPFVVKVLAAGVARYRVSFRDSKGSVIAHVDRRATGPLARHE